MPLRHTLPAMFVNCWLCYWNPDLSDPHFFLETIGNRTTATQLWNIDLQLSLGLWPFWPFSKKPFSYCRIDIHGLSFHGHVLNICQSQLSLLFNFLCFHF